MKYIENKLGRQLLLILIIVFDIILVTVLFFVPRMLKPIYETGIYNSLKGPVEFINQNLEITTTNKEVAYIYVTEDNVYTSKNYHKVVDIDKSVILSLLDKEFGSFKYKRKTYYYYSSKTENEFRVAIANESYLSKIKNDFMVSVVTIFLISFFIISLIVFVWSSIIVRKITKLKLKIDNIDNDNFNHNINFKSDDEIKSLASSIEDMRISLKEQEEYKNNMYQNISHDFKTPLAVIKSYIEAVEDGVEDKDKALSVIKDQTNNLEKKVYSLLYLNKLVYLKEKKQDTYNVIDIKEVINWKIHF